jgi:hypothetical protein
LDIVESPHSVLMCLHECSRGFTMAQIFLQLVEQAQSNGKVFWERHNIGAVEVNRRAIETQPGDMEAPRGVTNETREGWPLLTAEVNGDGDSRSTYEKGHSLVGSLGS